MGGTGAESSGRIGRWARMPFGRWRRLPTLAWVVLLVTTLAAAWFWHLTDGFVRRRAAERLAFRAHDVVDAISERMRTYESILMCGAAVFAVSEEVSRQRWRQFAVGSCFQERYPGVQGLGFALMLCPNEVAAHVRAVRAEGFPEYMVHPAGDRPQYSSIIFLEPFDERNRRAFGYDMFSEPVRRAAMEAARDSGAASVSGIVTLVQETERDVQRGILMYMPVYRVGMPSSTIAERRAALRGFVYSPFRVNDLMRGILANAADDLAFSVYDGDHPVPDRLLYAGRVIDASAGLQRSVPINLAGGRSWTICVAAGPAFVDYADRSLPVVVAVTSVVIGLLLASLVTVASRRAEQALVEEHQRLRNVLDGTRAGTWVWQVQTGEVVFNEIWAQIIGYRLDELGPLSIQTWQRFAHPDDLKRSHDLLERHFAGELPYYDCECRMRHKDGRWIWVHDRGRLVSRLPDGRPLQMFGTHIDITARKTAEESRERLQTEIRRREIEAMRHANRLAALGTMMAGLAHEFNHPAQVVRMNQESLHTLVEACARAVKGRSGLAVGMLGWDEVAYMAPALLDDLGQATTYLQELIEDVRCYANPDDDVCSPPCLPGLAAVAATSVRLVSSFARRRQVTIVSSLAIGANGTARRSSRLQQVAVNLLLNAIQASPVGGTVQLRCAETDGHPSLIISDEGLGIAPEVRARLGEPFVTTRAEDGGSGLGLSICLRLVAELGGTLTLVPRQPCGTIAHVRFPKAGMA